MRAGAGVPPGGVVISAPFQRHGVAVRVASGGGDIGQEIAAVGLSGHINCKAVDHRGVVDKLNGFALPCGGSAPFVHRPDADGVSTNLIVAVLLVLAAPLQTHSVPVRVGSHGIEVGIEPAILHVAGGVGGKAVDHGGGVGHGDSGKGAGQVAGIIPDGGGDGIGPLLKERQLAAVIGEEAGIAVQRDRLTAELHAPAHIQAARTADTHRELCADMDGIGRGDSQRGLEYDGNALAGGGGLAVAVPESGVQGVLTGFGKDHGAAVVTQIGKVQDAGCAVFLSGPCDRAALGIKELIHDHRDAVAHILHIRHGELQGAHRQDGNGVACGEGPAQAVPEGADQAEGAALGKPDRAAQVVEVAGDVVGEVCGFAILLQGPLHRQLDVVAEGSYLYRLAGVDLLLNDVHL